MQLANPCASKHPGVKWDPPENEIKNIQLAFSCQNIIFMLARFAELQVCLRIGKRMVTVNVITVLD